MNEFKLSKRLACVAGIINPGGVLADIGTDHGYLPVHVAKNNIASKVIAMDVRKKPLEKAAENIKLYGVSQKVELRLSDGLYKLAENEADTITICGMGGKLIQSILENGSSKISENTQLILSPQSEIREFRKYLSESGYETVKEYMISEDGQFYVIIDCRRNGYKNELICTDETEKEDKFEKRAAVSSNAAPRCDIYDYFLLCPHGWNEDCISEVYSGKRIFW